MNKLLVIVLLVLSVTNNNSMFLTGDGHTKDMMPLKGYTFDLNYMDRDKIGITRTYSPDNQKYFIEDPLGRFLAIYLSIENGTLEKIYNYPYDDAGRSEEVIEIYWNGMSDKIYLYFPFHPKSVKAVEYSISEKVWTDIDTSALNGEIIAPIYNSNEFIIKDTTGYKSFNFKSGQTKPLNIPAKYIYCDQNTNGILFCEIEYKFVQGVRYNIQNIKLYSPKANCLTDIVLPTTATIIQDPVIKFVPNTETEISYMDNLKVEESETAMRLVIFDYKSLKYKTYLLGTKLYTDWVANRHAVYGLDYILYLK